MVLDGYVRVSQVGRRSDERFISPVVQREQIERWAQLHGALVGHIFEELDQSGGRSDRPLLMQAVERVERGESDGLVVAYLSRFGRSHLDGLTTIDRGEVVELAKTRRSRRVPLSDRALDALDELPPRLDTPYVFPALRGGPFDLPNFRKREWQPAIEASGVQRPARTYDLRSTFASTALAARISVFELARVMGTSVAMIERHYGTLIEGAGADIARRLNASEAYRNSATEEGRETFRPLAGHEERPRPGASSR
jgi:hypothetical protein